jgi:hypothetical protein
LKIYGWAMAPPPEQIQQDILGLPAILEKITLARGCIVKNCALRSGRRLARHNGKGLLKDRRRDRQRKATLRAAPLDPQLQFLLDDIIGRQRIVEDIEIIIEDLESDDDDEASVRSAIGEHIDPDDTDDIAIDLFGLDINGDDDHEEEMEV